MFSKCFPCSDLVWTLNDSYLIPILAVVNYQNIKKIHRNFTIEHDDLFCQEGTIKICFFIIPSLKTKKINKGPEFYPT